MKQNKDFSELAKEARDKRIEVFKDTKEFYSSNKELQKHIENSEKMTEVFPAGFFKKKIQMPIGTEKSTVEVCRMSSGDAVYKYCEDPEKTAVLNFASATNPGGGVIAGSKAQEETLCRQSTLYKSLTLSACYKKYYNKNRRELFVRGNTFYNSGIIWTPDIVFFKNDNGELLEQDKWKSVNVITAAAPNLRFIKDPEERIRIVESTMEERILSVIRLAKLKGITTLILGAWGCGAFCNPPEVIAKLFKKVIDAERFETPMKIIFPIPALSPTDERKATLFKTVLVREDNK